MARPRRNSKKEAKKVKSKIYIFCEGEKTEPEYIQAYLQFNHPTCARLAKVERVVNIEKINKNTPVQLVDAAVKRQSSLDLAEDQVWVVYDRESEAKYPHELHQKAYDKATANDIGVAISNVCFEFWLLLHLKEQAPGMSDCDTLISSPAFKNAFKEIGIERYSKDADAAKRVSSALMQDEYIKCAVKNAERINAQTLAASGYTEKTPFRLKPYTNVHKLLEAIDEIAKQ